MQQIALRTAYVKSSVDRILLSLKKLGHIEKTDPSKIALDLDRVRRKGYPLNDEERPSGQCSWPPRYSIPVSGYAAAYR
jgi:DNA-binding IclR family transcriptional regulator